MNRYKIIDIANWKRRELFTFFRKFDRQCVQVDAEVEAQALYDYAKKNGESFFLLALYAIARAANAVPEFRYRMLDGSPVEFERIDVMTPVIGPDDLYRNVSCECTPDFRSFKAKFIPIAEAAKKSAASIPERTPDFICASCLPWLHFSAISQAGRSGDEDIPVMAWGKLENGKIPVNVQVNHSFVDGLHICRFFDEIRRGFSAPQEL
ncbi:MAG: CatA-like O-acetyltransferase [Victivallaceae bacterium]|nr:CatA-like O-acetyltransferase [Victivallaceae bacterium]